MTDKDSCLFTSEMINSLKQIDDTYMFCLLAKNAGLGVPCPTFQCAFFFLNGFKINRSEIANIIACRELSGTNIHLGS